VEKGKPMPAQPGDTIGRFEVVRPLGQGSQGAVYLAKDPTLDRLVALKLLTSDDSELGGTAANGAPLEAVIAGKLNHPNIVPIFDAGEHDGRTYLIFEYVEGQTLSDRLKQEGPMALENAVPTFRAVLEGMAAAHEAGILHLDLNPRNILLNALGVPRVMDFGLSRFADVTRINSEYATGTLRYMAPEHFLCRPLGAWTDVFALGSTFFELVTGVPAMRGSSMPEIRERIITVDVDFEPLLAVEHGEAFARFLAGALLPSAQGRYRDGAAMRDAFLLFLEESGLVERLPHGGSRHSTIDFLLRRMQRKKDFPTISSTLADINRLTSDDSDTSADKLANVILRDMALTSKLLKLVNSAFYGARAAEITSISQAVVFLGLEQVRMTANSLTLFGHLKNDSSLLRDSMIRSFLAGLLARHLARREKLGGAEEAFIAGLCQNLGENLVIYYFADDYGDIEAARKSEGMDKQAASRGILGVSYAELGVAVARVWSLPQAIVDAINGPPPGPLRANSGNGKRMRDLCVLANELADLFVTGTRAAEIDERLPVLLRRFEPAAAMDENYARKLLGAGFEKLRAYAPVFEVDIGRSEYCRRIADWLDSDSEPARPEARSA